MHVLGIESTCDETACSIVVDGHNILSNVISSQIELHNIYGGVVPELACRRHVEIMIPVIDQALKDAKVSLEEIDLIAASYGPGLIGALLIGLNAAKALALATGKPFIGVNHIEAHLYAAMMPRLDEIQFPCLGVVVSGGHTSLVLVRSIGRYELIGQTVDDALGEAFDKVAKLMGLPYPGGPQIESLAAEGNPRAFSFKSGTVKGKPLDFSFSGLKTAVLYAIKGQNAQNPIAMDAAKMVDLAASFQYVALGDVVDKVNRACQEYGCKQIVLGGGVTHNREFRRRIDNLGLQTFWPQHGLSLDNAAMIAGLGYQRYQLQGSGDPLTLEPQTRITWGSGQ